MVEVDVRPKPEPLPNAMDGAGSAAAVVEEIGVKVKPAGLGNRFAVEDVMSGLAVATVVEAVVTEASAVAGVPNAIEGAFVLVANDDGNELDPNENAGCGEKEVVVVVGATAVVIVDGGRKEVLLDTPKGIVDGTLGGAMTAIGVTTVVVVVLALAVDIGVKG